MYIRAPHSIDFDITLKCNLLCTHCNVSGGHPLADELTTDQIKSLISQFYDAGVAVLALTGGEPLTHPDWHEIVNHACSLPGWHIILNTNGVLFDRDSIREVVHSCPSLQIAVSLDGHDAVSYGQIRKSADGSPAVKEFNTVVENIRLLKEAGVKNVSLNYLLTDRSLDSFRPMAELASSLGVGLLGIKFFPYGRGLDNTQYEPRFDAWSDFLLSVTDEKKSGDPIWKRAGISVTTPWEFLLPFALHGDVQDAYKVWGYLSPLQKDTYRKVRDIGCGAGVIGCAVSPEGQLMPCGTVSANYESLECGSLAIHGFASVWQQSKRLDVFRRIRLADIGEPCTSCIISDLCGGGCRARAHILNSSLLAPDPYCPIAKGLMRAGGG